MAFTEEAECAVRIFLSLIASGFIGIARRMPAPWKALARSQDARIDLRCAETCLCVTQHRRILAYQ